MPPKRPVSRSQMPLERHESLQITAEERLATSKSLYGDHKARVSANTHQIHDRLRIKAYTTAISAAAKGKSVLVLGCGMGLLSMLAARTPASHVVAVDTSTIVQNAKVVAEKNKIANITFLHGSLSKGTATLPTDHAGPFDLILCEWMNSMLVNDPSQIQEMLFCKQKYLAPGGIVCPNQASLSVAAITDYQYKCETVDYWDNVYGFNMAPMKELVMREPTGAPIPKHLVMTNQCPCVELNVDTLAPASDEAALKANSNLVVEGDFTLKATGKTTLHFLTIYVSAANLHASCPLANFQLPSTPGGSNPWTEVSAALPEPLPVFVGDVIEGHIKVVPKGNDTEVHLDISFSNDLLTHKSSTVHHFQY